MRCCLLVWLKEIISATIHLHIPRACLLFPLVSVSCFFVLFRFGSELVFDNKISAGDMATVSTGTMFVL